MAIGERRSTGRRERPGRGIGRRLPSSSRGVAPPGLPGLAPLEGVDPKLNRDTRSVLGSFLERHELLPEDVAKNVYQYATSKDRNRAVQLSVQLGSQGLHGLEWVGDKVMRIEKAMATPLAALRQHIAPIDSTKDLGDKNLVEAFMMGIRNDPGAVSIGEFVIPDEIADYHIPLMHRLTGLTLGHTRIVADIALSPLSYIGRAKTVAAFVGKGRSMTEMVHLSRKGAKLQKVLVDEAIERGNRVMKARIRQRWERSINKPDTIKELAPTPMWWERSVKKTVAVKEWVPNPMSSLSIDEQIAVEAAQAADRAATFSVAKRLEKAIFEDSSLVQRPGYYIFNKFLIMPTQPFSRAFRAAWDKAPGSEWIENRVLRGFKDSFDRMLQEVDKGTKGFAPWVPALLSQSRAIESQVRDEGRRYLTGLFKHVPKDVRVNIQKHMVYRGKGEAYADRARAALDAIPEEYVPVIDQLDAASLRWTSELRAHGLHIEPEFGYAPVRYDFGSGFDGLARREKWNGHIKDQHKPLVDLGTETARYSRQFKTPDEAMAKMVELEIAKDLDEASKYVMWDAADAWNRRLNEQARMMADRHTARVLERRVGLRTSTLRQRIFIQRFHELGDRTPAEVVQHFTQTGLPDITAKNIDEVARILQLDEEAGGLADLVRAIEDVKPLTPQEKAIVDWARADNLVGQAENLVAKSERIVARSRELGKLRAKGSKLTPHERAQAKSAISEIHGRMRNLPDGARALALEGMARNISSMDDVEHYLRTFGRYIDKARVEDLNNVRKAVGGLTPESLTDALGVAYKQVDGPNVAKELKGLWLPEPIVKYLTDADSPFAKFTPPHVARALRTHDWLLSRFKLAATVGVPGANIAFNIRNAYNDIAQAFVQIGMSALDPRYAARAFQIVKGGDGFVKVAGRNVPIQQIRKELFSLHVMSTPHRNLEIMDREGIRRLVLGNNLTRKAHKAYTKSTLDLSTARENIGRIHLYLQQRNLGVAPEMAAHMVNKVFFDYGALSSVEKAVFRRIFPFWTWNRKNFELQMQQIRDNPGRLSQMIQLGTEDYGPDEAFLPEYMSGEFKLGVTHRKDGKVGFITGVDLPIGAFFENAPIPGQFQEAFKSWTNQAAPWKSLFEVFVAQKSFYSGQDLSPEGRQYVQGIGPVIEHLPKPMQDWLDYRYETDPDGTVHKTVNAAKWHIWVKSTVLSRVAGSTDRFVRNLENEEVPFMVSMIDFLGGIRYHEFDLSKRQEANMRRNLSILRRLGKQYGILYDFTIPAESRRERTKR